MTSDATSSIQDLSILLSALQRVLNIAYVNGISINRCFNNLFKKEIKNEEKFPFLHIVSNKKNMKLRGEREMKTQESSI